jgi:septal ring factor EnvC (AmiA/AmiB activator)
MRTLFLILLLLLANLSGQAQTPEDTVNSELALPADRSEQPDRLQQLSQRIEEIKAQQLRLEQETKTLGQRNNQLNSEISNLDHELAKLQQESLALNESLLLAQEKVEETTGRVVELAKLSSLRLRAFYSASRTDSLLLSADSSLGHSSSKNFFYLKKLRQFETNNILELKRLKSQLQFENEELKKTQVRLSLAQEGLSVTRNDLALKKLEATKLQDQLKKAKAANSKLISQFRAEMLRIEIALKALSLESAPVAATLSAVESEEPKSEQSKEESAAGLSNFSAPVQGQVVSKFGSKIADLSAEKQQLQGLGFLASEAAEVRAVGGGKVVFCGRLGDYGQVVILDHGQRQHSLYGLLASTSVKTGQNLKVGEPLGLTGKLEPAKAFNLYFELRHEGKPQDPSSRLLSN